MAILRNFISIAIACFLLHLPAEACKQQRIKTQKEFDDAVERINRGEETTICLAKGTFVLKNRILAKAPLTIKGNGATIKCYRNSFLPENAIRETKTHYVYKLDEILSLFPLLYDERDKLIPISESVQDGPNVNYVDGIIEGPSDYEPGAKIKIPIASNLAHLKNKTFDCAFGYFDSGWSVVNISVEKSDDKFFYCTTLNSCYTKDYQYDSREYKKPVRYVLYNAELLPNMAFYDREYLYIPKSVKNLYVLDNVDEKHFIPTLTTYSDIEICGVYFVGMSGLLLKSPLKAKCHINNCQFSNCLGQALCIDKENGDEVEVARVHNCEFKNCSLYSDNIIQLYSTFANKPCISIENNVIARYPDARVIYKNTQGALWANGDVSITNNIIFNTCRDHLFLRRGYNFVKGNFLYNTDEFNSKIDRNLSSDWGLIYSGAITRNSEEAQKNTENIILIEENLLYGAYAYGEDARGVFLDSGRGDVTCRENIILNTQCYSLDSRVISSEDASSIRNKYERNIVSSNYRLQAGHAAGDLDIPFTSGNILLTNSENQISRVRIIIKDTRIERINLSMSLNETWLYVSKDLYTIMRKSPTWKKSKKHVRLLL